MKGATEYADSATTVFLVEKRPHSRSDNETTLYFAKQRVAHEELKPINLHLNRNKCMFEEEIEIHETDEETQIILKIPKE